MKRGLFIIFLALILLPFASADIYINGLKDVYNVGDIVEAEVTLSSSVYTSGFFISYLVCGVNEIETYLSMEGINPGEEKVISVRAIIDNNIIGDLIGECYLRSLYGSGEVRSPVFKISRFVRVSMDINDISFFPGDSVDISGRIVKDNGELLNGFVNIIVEGIDVKIPTIVQNEQIESNENNTNAEENQSINSTNETVSNETEIVNQTEIEENLNETISNETGNESQIENASVPQSIILGSIFAEVIDGVFSGSFVISNNAPPGTYRVNARAYDLDLQGVVMSSGESSRNIEVQQVIRDIGIAFNSDSIIPGNEFLYTPLLYDQAGNYAEGDVAVRVYMPDKSLFIERLLRAGETNSIMIGLNYTPGFWGVNASSVSLLTVSFVLLID